MHFLQVIPHYLPATRFGGPQHVAHGLGKALVAEGHQVSVCTTNLQDEVSNLDVPLEVPVDRDGVSVYYAPTCISRYWGYSPALGRLLKNLMPASDIVLVHAHYQYANWIGAKLARRYQKPYAWFAHGSLRNTAVSERGRIRKALYLATLERANLQQASLLVFNADEERDGSRYAERGIVVPNGIDPADFQSLPTRGNFRRDHRLPEQAIVLLYLGRLDVPRKGLDLLLPAFAQARKSDPRLYLVMVGPDERNGRQAIQRLVERHGLESAVRLIGLLTGSDKLAALVDADAFVLPSRSEGLSISLLEALYLGLPVLVSDQVGLHRTIRELQAGVVVPPTIPHVLAGITQLVQPQSLSAMCGRAREWVETFHMWPAIARQLLNALDPHGHAPGENQPHPEEAVERLCQQ